MLDLRPETPFAASHIRKAIHVTQETLVDQIIVAMLAYKDGLFRSHYQHDTMTRLLFVFPKEQSSQFKDMLAQMLPQVN